MAEHDGRRYTDAINLMNMAHIVLQRADHMHLRHLIQGVEGYAEFVFPYLANRILVQTDGKIKNGDTIAKLVFKALKNRSIRLAEDHLRQLFERRDSLPVDDVPALDTLNCEIVRLKQLVDNYDEFFGPDDRKMLQRMILLNLKKRLEAYDAQRRQEEGRPDEKRRRTKL